MERDYSAFCYAGASYRIEYTALPTGVELQCIIFTPANMVSTPVVLFVPGLVSIIENFRGTIIELTRTHVVWYLETREKSSARISSRHRFTVAEIEEDIGHFVNMAFPDEVSYVMAGYSLGATAIAGASSRVRNRPDSIILVQPNASFPFQGWLLLLARVARYIYKPLKPFLKWYMRTFIIDTKQDEEMYNINCRNLDNAEPVRLGKAIRDLSSYRMDDCMHRINVPALVVVASSDNFHNHGEGAEIARRINGAVYLDLSDNKRTHSAEMGRIISEFISSQAQKSVQEDPLLQGIS